MTRRDLLLIACCLGGLAAVGATLQSSQRPAPLQRGPERLRERVDAWRDIAAVAAAVDRQFAESWQARGLEPAPAAPELTRIRRASLALIGSIPSFEELRALEQIEPAGRQRWWVDYLLADQRAARHIGERLTRALVGTEQGPFLLYRRSRFRDWLAEQVRDNRPYDELVGELIAGNGLWTTSPSVNFLTATLDANNDNQPDPIRLAARTSRAFLGMRIDCLQCHDDNLGNVELGELGEPRGGTQRDFHQLAAFFCEARVSAPGVRDGEGTYEAEYLGSTEPEATDAAPPYGRQWRRAEGPLRQQLAAWVTAPENRPFARTAVNRVWALVFGKPLVEPIDDIPLHTPPHGYPPGLETLADDFIQHGYDLHRLIRVVLSLRPLQLDSRDPRHPVSETHFRHWAAFPLTRLRPEQMAGSIVQACSLESIDSHRHVIVQLKSAAERNDFVERYGDTGEDEFVERACTISQRLVIMNGDLIKESTQPNALMNAASRIAVLAPDSRRAVEVAYLCALSRRPSAAELETFAPRLDEGAGQRRLQAMEDLFWVLLNSSEFASNH